MASYLLIDDESLYAIVTPDPKYANVREKVWRQLERQSAWLIPFISLVWVEDILVAAWKKGELSREEMDDVRESIDALSDIFLFADVEVGRRYVDQVRRTIRDKGEAPTYDAWITSLIDAAREQRPEADVRFLTLNVRVADTMPLDDVVLIDAEALLTPSQPRGEAERGDDVRGQPAVGGGRGRLGQEGENGRHARGTPDAAPRKETTVVIQALFPTRP